MRAGITGEQARPRPDVGAGQFKLATGLTRGLAVLADIGMAPIAMPFDLGLGNVSDEVLVELAGGCEVATAAMGTLLGMDIVFDEGRVRRRLRPEAARMFAEFLAATIFRDAFRIGARPRLFAALEDGLELLLEVRKPLPQLGVLRLQLGDATVSVVHDDHNLTENAKPGKRSCLTVTGDEYGKISRKTGDEMPRICESHKTPLQFEVCISTIHNRRPIESDVENGICHSENISFVGVLADCRFH
jgi:hypothetical protein